MSKGGTGSLTYVGGGKVGVGKSLLAMSVIDYWRKQKRPVVLVEAETTNSDVYHSYSPLLDQSSVHALDLQQGAGGWHELGDILARHGDAEIVVNTPAGMAEAYRKYGAQVDALGSMTGRFTTLWPINRLGDSVQLLARYMDAVPGARVVVIKNLFFGDAHRFRRFDESNLRQKNPQMSIGELPDLDDDLIDIIDGRVPLEKVGDRTNVMRRITMDQWRGQVHQMLASVL